MPEWTFVPVHKASQERLPEMKVEAGSLIEAYQIADLKLTIERNVDNSEYGLLTTNHTVGGNPVSCPIE